MKRQERTFPVILFVYHVLLTVIAWQYYLHHGGDAQRYWQLSNDWSSYLNVGTDVINFINYPFVSILRLPFWCGFVMYSFIGYYAIYELYRFAVTYIEPSTALISNLLLLVFLLPNLHFWTSVIGKEPIVFLAITWIIINYSEKKYLSFKFLFGALILMLIRPHVALFLLISIAIAVIINDRKSLRKKMTMGIGAAVLSLGLYLVTMHLLNRNPFGIAHILERNEASLIAFKRAGSYVPMINYNVVERIFALNFRPLFWESKTLFDFVLSAENFLVLILLFVAMLAYIIHYKKVKSDTLSQTVFLFFLISSLFFIQRYSCFGIFVRTKTMYLPFLLIAAVKVLSSVHFFSKSSQIK